MIIWGGLDANFQDAIGGARFNPQTGEWRAMSEENAPTARAFAASVWTGSEFIVWGGQTASFEILSGGGRYDPATDVWRTMTAVGEPTKRTANSAIWTGTGMLVWGGFNFEDRNRNDGAIYNPASDTWTPVSTNGAPRERAGHAAIWTGGEMVIWGGQTEQSEQLLLIDGARFNPTAGAWSPIQTAGAPTGRVEPRALWTGEEMIICGGWPGIEGGSVRGNGWGGRYWPASNTWAEDGVPPSTREGHSAVFTGQKMIVWGGHNQQWQGDGADYDLISNTWRRLPEQGAPSARTHQGSFWTGTEMFVWGGYGAGGYLNDGGRYDAVSRTWKGINTSNAPSAREWVNPVWTGSKIIVWGGRAADDYRHDGAVYDPASDEWTAMNTNGAPRGRMGHSVAWTGDELIVWSGFGWERLNPKFDNHLGDGGRYDISTGEWRGMSTNSAPSPRYRHSTVWTGTKMIVWGGASRDGLVNDGGIYDPEGDAWVSISTEGAPQSRAEHAAVWTGREMIIWGGLTTGFQNRTVALNDGARYDPLENRWIPLRFESRARPRYGHSAIWTGTDMIIWGGHDVGNTDFEQHWNDTWSYSPMEPELLIRLHGAEQEISWPHPSSGFVLERSWGLVGTWEVVTRVPLRLGSAWRVKDDAAFAEKAFYRLRKFE